MSLYEYGLVLQKNIDSFLFRVPDCNILIPKLIKGSFSVKPTYNLQRKLVAAMAGTTNAASKLMKSVFDVLLSQEAKGFDRVLSKV